MLLDVSSRTLPFCLTYVFTISHNGTHFLGFLRSLLSVVLSIKILKAFLTCYVLAIFSSQLNLPDLTTLTILCEC